jgi:hypothetical protein
MAFGPGLLVMEADNDAGTVSTYVEASAVVERYPESASGSGSKMPLSP